MKQIPQVCVPYKSIDFISSRQTLQKFISMSKHFVSKCLLVHVHTRDHMKELTIFVTQSI